MNIELDVMDADLQNVSTGDNVDPDLGLKLKVYNTGTTDPDLGQLATILLARDLNGDLVLTVYRDFDIPIKIQTVDYFDGSRDHIDGSHPDYYTVLRDR
jgi:uncharacterized protein (DUF608 family)